MIGGTGGGEGGKVALGVQGPFLLLLLFSCLFLDVCLISSRCWEK